jgi:hypothetical protein
MRTPLALDDELLADAELYTGMREKSALARRGAQGVGRVRAVRRLAGLGGTEPDLKKSLGDVRNPSDPRRYVGLDRGVMTIFPVSTVENSRARCRRSAEMISLSF